MTKEELIEALADKEHASWAHWMEWLFRCSTLNNDGDTVIPHLFADMWLKQVNTPYAELSESEKQSDRNEVEHILPFIDQYVEAERDALRARLAKMAAILDLSPDDARVRLIVAEQQLAEAEQIIAAVARIEYWNCTFGQRGDEKPSPKDNAEDDRHAPECVVTRHARAYQAKYARADAEHAQPPVVTWCDDCGKARHDGPCVADDAQPVGKVDLRKQIDQGIDNLAALVDRLREDLPPHQPETEA